MILVLWNTIIENEYMKDCKIYNLFQTKKSYPGCLGNFRWSNGAENCMLAESDCSANQMRPGQFAWRFISVWSLLPRIKKAFGKEYCLYVRVSRYLKSTLESDWPNAAGTVIASLRSRRSAEEGKNHGSSREKFARFWSKLPILNFLNLSETYQKPLNYPRNPPKRGQKKFRTTWNKLLSFFDLFSHN